MMFDAEEFGRVDMKLQGHMDELGLEPIKLYPVNKIVRIDAYGYWKKHRTRLPKALEALNSVADKVMTALYRKLFR